MSNISPNNFKILDKELADLYTEMALMSSNMYDSLYQRNKKDYLMFAEKYRTVKKLYKSIGDRLQMIKELVDNPDLPVFDED